MILTEMFLGSNVSWRVARGSEEISTLYIPRESGVLLLKEQHTFEDLALGFTTEDFQHLVG